MGAAHSQTDDRAFDHDIPDEQLSTASVLFTRASAICAAQHDFRPDYRRASRLFQSAFDKSGHVESAFRLAELLHMGKEGLPRQPSKAFKLYEHAASNNHPHAMNNLGFMLWRGDDGVRKDIPRAYDLLVKAAQLSPGLVAKIRLAKFLLSEDSLHLRNPARAAHLLEQAIQHSANAFALHELAVLYEKGDDGVPQNPERAMQLHIQASVASYGPVGITTTGGRIIAAGQQYVKEIEHILSSWYARPNTCLLLTLGGGGRGKTCTVNSMRGMSFVAEHVPTEMAALSKFILDPGNREIDQAVIAECDFNENSLRANASRLYEAEEVENCSTYANEEGRRSMQHAEKRPRLHEDVIEKMRRALTQYRFPRGFKGSVVQVWDMAGQSEYEMAHSLFIARADILVFVTDLQKVADENTRKSEVELLCYWMQLAYVLVPDPSRVRAVIVGTRKDTCAVDGAQILQILRDCLANQLGEAVYDSWITEREDNEQSEVRNIIAIENSTAERDPSGSGLESLEVTVKRAADTVVSERGRVPVRWLAFIDKLERQPQHHFSWDDIRAFSVGFPGFETDPELRERDILQGIKCFASTGRVVLFELSDTERYVFTDVVKIIDLVGKVTAPERSLRNRLCSADICRLRKGHITKPALFKLWSGYTHDEKELILKLLYQFDLLIQLEASPQSATGHDVIGVPALLDSGWDNFKWGKAKGESDLEVLTLFAEAIPGGLVGRLIAFLYRVFGSGTTAVSLVSANAALLEAKDSSRLFVGFKGAKRALCWTFRGRNPMRLARECLRHVEELLIGPQWGLRVRRRHVILQDCSTSNEGCGAEKSVEVLLSGEWIYSEENGLLPIGRVPCGECRKPWDIGEITSITFGAAQAPSPWQQVTTQQDYDLFISHAGPDKHVLAHPLYKAFKRHNIHSFLDMEELQISRATAPELMVQAMETARMGIFILSPEFAARKWTMKEMIHFIQRSKRCDENDPNRPVLLPIFYRLDINECGGFYEARERQQMLQDAGFFSETRQSECSTAMAAEALRCITAYSGIEVKRLGGGESLSSAAIVEEAVRRVLSIVVSKT